MAGSLNKTDKKSSPAVCKQKNAVSTVSLAPQCAKNNLNIRKKKSLSRLELMQRYMSDFCLHVSGPKIKK